MDVDPRVKAHGVLRPERSLILTPTPAGRSGAYSTMNEIVWLQSCATLFRITR
jgi:hypothetical protein